MNTRVAVALLLSPLMVHAQANLPAQPQATPAAVLESRLAMPAGLMLSSSSPADTDATANPTGVRISTGIVEPKLIRMVPIQEDTVSAAGWVKRDHEAVVSLIVDEKGKTSDLKIVQSAGADLDRDILQAVKQFRYQPATVSGQVTPVPVILHMLIREPIE